MANLGNQPENTNLANQTNYQLIIPKSPGVTWFCTKAKVPDVTGAGAEQSSTHAKIYHPGDYGVFQDLSVTYLLDEDLNNWSELFVWWKDYAMPINHTPRSKSDAELVCDIELIVLNNNKKPTHRFIFTNAFPIYIEGPPYDVNVTDIAPIALNVTFRYTTYDYLPLSGIMPDCYGETTP